MKLFVGFRVLFFILLCGQGFCLSAPYDQLRLLQPFRMSWKLGPPKAKFDEFEHAPFMEQLIRHIGAKTVIELGSYLGGSAIYIAQCLPEGGRHYCVDHWESPESLWDAPPYAKGLAPSDANGVYGQFLSNMIHAGTADTVIPVRMCTEKAVGYFLENRIVPDLVYVDAAHDEASVYADLSAYFPMIRGRGVICGDDWNHSERSVEKAVRRFAEENGLKIWVSPTNQRLWILEEPGSDVLSFLE